MVRQTDIFKKKQKDGTLNTYIKIGSSEMDIPSSMLQGEKENILFWKDGKIEEINWEGFHIVENTNCLNIGKNLDLIPLAEIAFSQRKNSLNFIINLCDAYKDLNGKIYTIGEITPLSTVYFTSDGGVLFLPYQIYAIIDTIIDDSFRFDDKEVWWGPNTIFEDFLFPNFLIQLLYFSLSGQPPYYSENVRNDKFHPEPLSYKNQNDAAKLCDRVLNFKRKETMYPKPVDWIENELKNISPDIDSYKKVQCPELIDFLQKQQKRAKFNIFVRNHGAKTLAITVSTIIVIVILASWIAKITAPPLTRGDTPTQIIESYYQAQNDLDIEMLETSLYKKVKSPFSTEITNLFVTSRVRMAYEKKDTIIDPISWIENGKQPIDAAANIYGNSDLKIKQIDSDTWEASCLFYSPSDYIGNADSEVEATLETPTEKEVYIYKYVEQYDFIQVKDWYEISNIKTISLTLVEKLTIPIETVTN